MNIGKPFRLIDFKTFDATPSSLRSAAVSNGDADGDDEDSDSGSGSDESAKSSSKRVFEPRQFLIQMFGVNEQGQTCSVIVEDFRPFFYMRVGDEWNEGMVQVFVQELVRMTGQPWLHKQIVQAKLVQYHKLYGFSGGKKDRFIHVVCLNSTVFSRLKNLWYKKDPRTGQRRLRALPFHGTSVELYESNIPPLLRFFHLQNVSPSGWVSILHNRAFKPTVKTTSCTFEYVCLQKHVVPLPEKETRVPYKIMSFDIEASSSHGDFPLPQKTYKKLAQNIVDLFLENFSDPQTADRASVGELVRRCMLTAFGFGSFEGVDLVYPKRPPPLERVHRAVDVLLSMPLVRVDSLVHAEGEEDKTQLLTLSAMFDKMREHMDAGSGGGGGGGNDEDEDPDDLAAAAAVDDEPDEPDAAAPVYVSGVEVDQSCTLVDLLLSAQYSRDSKITRIDETLTRQLPTLKGDEVTFIGSTFLRYGDAEPHLNHCFAVGDCDAVPGCVVETAPTEREMLMRWAQLVRREDPDIVIGYNIFGFDYEFMFRRAIETHCVDEFLQLSRRLGEVCVKDDPFAAHDGGARQPQIDRTTIALASGDYDLNFVKMSGRLQIDMYMYLRREYQFGSYRLDDMASYFISDDIKRVEVVHGDGAHGAHGADNAPHTWLYSQNLMGLHVGDFIHIEITSFTSDYYADGKKFEVVDIRREGGSNVIVVAGDHGSLSGMKNIKWGMAKDDVTPQDIFAMTKGSPADRARVAKYCIQDCNLVHHLLNKVDVLTGYIEMSSICSVPISFLVFRGQGIKLQSYVAKKCREKETLMPDLDKTGSNEGYEGAIVLPPKCSMYMDNPVACVDYESLYPSGMISENFSHDSKVWTKEYDLSGNLIRETGEKDPRTGGYKYDHLPGYRYIDREFDTYRYVRKTPTSAAVKTKSGKMVCRWAQFPDDKKGIMPSILQELLKARADTRKKAKVEPDPFMQNVLDKRQLGYKVTANSLYGQCGAKTSSFYEKDVAASTTATGRMMITYARRIIEEVYGQRVYHTEGHGPVLTKAEYVYGDSVASYTPVYVKVGDTVNICTIEQLADMYGAATGWVPCLEEGKQEKEVCKLQADVQTWTDQGWTRLYRVIRHALAPHKRMVRVLTHTGLVDCTDDHSLLRYGDAAMLSPDACTAGSTALQHTPMRQRVHVDNWCVEKRFPLTDMIAAARYANALNAHRIRFDLRLDQDASVVVVRPHGKPRPALAEEDAEPVDDCVIQSMTPLASYTGYVYDLTTDNHHFAAGVGNLIVHNTDSVFFTFNLADPSTGEPIRGKRALEITIEIAQDAAHLCSRFLKPPMRLAYEKTLMPFVLLKKKRYFGMLYETDPNKGKLKYMGLSLKRRDSCDYLKDTYGGILNILMKEHDLMKSIEFLHIALERLVQGQVPMDKLTITRALSSYYKNPQQIAHAVLAERIAKRDPGNKPKPGDRIKYVFFENPHAKLQGDKIELPEYVVAQGLKVDYAHYIERQLMKPLQQLYGLALDQIWAKQNKMLAIRSHAKDVAELRKKYPDQETFAKKHDEFCSKKVKPLLFDKWLTQVANKRNHVQDIAQFFIKKPKL